MQSNYASGTYYYTYDDPKEVPQKESTEKGALKNIRDIAREALEYSNKNVDNPDLNQVRMWNGILDAVNRAMPAPQVVVDFIDFGSAPFGIFPANLAEAGGVMGVAVDE